MSKYIDKDKVLEYIIFGVVGKDITCGELARAIESLPTIEVSERQGEWEDFKNGCKCTTCGRWSNRMSDYCPNCGAKMDKE